MTYYIFYRQLVHIHFVFALAISAPIPTTLALRDTDTVRHIQTRPGGIAAGQDGEHTVSSAPQLSNYQVKLDMVYGVWYMVYGIWYMVYGIWCMVYGIWYMVYGIWYMVYGIWYMVYGVWC
ncbi:hypothetical protein EON65_35765, partial [archaeon]